MPTSKLRIGQGIDIHRLVSDRPLIIGGVQIPYEKGLDGHSDADVLLHALVDAILGATGKGDIGTYFPNTDPKWKNTDSKEFVKQVFEKISKEGWSIINIDATIIAEAPKLSPHIPKMKEIISTLLEIDIGECAIKATTPEGLGSFGRGEGIFASCVVLIEKRENSNLKSSAWV